MSIRKEALENQAFVQLKEYYDNRQKAAEEWKKRGKKVVGVLGADVPEELLIAADMLPYPIFGEADLQLTEADKYLEFSFPLTVRAQFEKILDGTDSGVMDYLVISNSTDALTRIYYYIREMKQMESWRPIPELYFIDWLFTRARMHQLRNETVIGQFRKLLIKWSGKSMDNASIRDAAALCNENRAALEELSGLRRQGRIMGSEALVIIGAGLYMDKQSHTRLVKELLQEAGGWPEAGGVPLFATGSAQEHTDFYQLVEACGGNIVSEDHDFGDRYWKRQTDTALDPVKGIVDRYMLRSAGTKRAFVSERVEAVSSAARACGAKGMISYTCQYDEAPSWDFPSLAQALRQEGIASLQLLNGTYSPDRDQVLAGTLKQFISEIKGE